MKKYFNKISKIIISSLIVLTCFLNSTQIVFAQTQATQKPTLQEPVEFIDENGNVIAIFIPDENSTPSIKTRMSYIIDWQIAGYDTRRSPSLGYFTTSKSIQLNISVSPTTYSRIGLFNMQSGNMTWMESSAVGFSGKIKFLYAGEYAIAIENTSSHTGNYTGSISY